MEKSLLERMKDSRAEYECKLVSLYGAGRIEEDKRWMAEYLGEANDTKAFNSIDSQLCELARLYTLSGEYDSIDLDLSMGIVYNKDDIEDGKVKNGAEPIDGIIRYASVGSRSYLNHDKVSDSLKGVYYGLASFITIDNLISCIEDAGLSYEGPYSYEEVKESILSDVPVYATVTARLSKKKSKTLIKK